MHTPFKKLAHLLSLTFRIKLSYKLQKDTVREPLLVVLPHAKPKNLDNLDPHLTQVTPMANQCLAMTAGSREYVFPLV